MMNNVRKNSRASRRGCFKILSEYVFTNLAAGVKQTKVFSRRSRTRTGIYNG